MPLGEGPHGIRFKYLHISSELVAFYVGEGQTVEVVAKRAFGFGPFDVRYFTRRETAIAVEVREPE